MDPNNIEKWKMKRLIKFLESIKGNGTSMITLIIPKGSQITFASQMLTTELSTASNIKSRVNRLSVLSAIKAAQEKLKKYNRTPENGLIILCGTAMIENKEKKISIDLEPFKPVNTSLYMCDNLFHIESLKEMLNDDEKYGFIIVDGKETLYAVIQGSDCEILYHFTVDLPKKHHKGGQSAARFGRLRLEKRQNYITKVNEHAVKCFIESDKVNVKGLIIAGSAELKNELVKDIDKRLTDKIIKVVDIQKGGKNGFNEAIELSADALTFTKIAEEKKIIASLMDHIAKNTGLYMFGINETMMLYELDIGAIETLIIWDKLETVRYKILEDNREKYVYRSKDEYTILESEPLLDYLLEKCNDCCSIKLSIVSDVSPEGSQFCNGFGGLAAILRYPVNLELNEIDFENNDDEISESDFM